MEVAYPPSKLVVYLLDLNLDDVLVSLELLLCRVSSDLSATEY